MFYVSLSSPHSLLKIVKILVLLFYVYGDLPSCMFMNPMCTVPTETRRKALDSLELELQRVMSCLVGVGNKTLGEQPMILVIEAPLQPYSIVFAC